MRRSVMLIAGLALLAGLSHTPSAWAAAGDPPPWRPYPDLPDVLFYENYEVNHDWNILGSYITDTPPAAGQPPSPVKPASGQRCYKFGNCEWDKNGKTVWQQLLIKEKTKLRFFDGLDPMQVHIHCKIWTDHGGTFEFKCFANNAVLWDNTNGIKVNTWTPINIKLGELRDKATKFKPDSLMERFEIMFHPKPVPASLPNVYIDDLIITVHQPAEQMLPLAQAKEGKNKDLERDPVKDGYSFNAACAQMLSSALHGKKKHKGKTVVVAGPQGDLSTALDKALEGANAKKRSGLRVVTMSDGDGNSGGGISDLRALLPYALQKNDATVALLVLAPSDAAAKKGLDDLRVVFERTLAQGCVPVPCLPAPPDGALKGAVEAFNKGVRDHCLKLGLPWIEQSFALKDQSKDADLTPAGVDAVAVLSLSALQSVFEGLPSER